ncbi:tRNA pseudouridine(55) synthase TruB [Spiroplasma endosymbiont of Poecilobothrus nobilitatus]|uniref:tRNA pseudouridine(55) synthase TruB n=1 Tax=Spiroplasma endosymbiont of Poecilobothrus nobilitatus TaxID=1209220 RepID=UPI00313D71FE
MHDGIFLINKPTGKTSNQVIQEIKQKLQINKIGHAGTLDPLATGLLVVLVNNATKMSEYLLTTDKAYDVEMRLFVETDTGDITGNVLNETVQFKIQKKILKKIFNEFNGFMYEQYPPKYSAIKVNGKKLYEYARQDKEVKIKPRTITIKAIKLKKYDAHNHTIKFIVLCTKGTYIRSLVTDIAAKLNTIATVTALCRTQSGNFMLSKAISPEAVNFNELISMYDALFTNNQQLLLYHHDEEIRQGKPIVIINHTDPIIFIIDKNKNVLAIYKHISKHVYACQRGLWGHIEPKNQDDREKDDHY